MTGGVFAGGVAIYKHVCPDGECSPSVAPVPAGTDLSLPDQQPNNPPPVNQQPVADYYLHFSCGGSSQCAQVIGYSYGVDPAARYAMTQAQCQNLVNTNAMGMQPWNGHAGTWCSTNRNASRQPP